MITRLDSIDPNFYSSLSSILEFDSNEDESIEKTVNLILKDIKNDGDKALLNYTRKFDRLNVDSPDKLEIPKEEWIKSLNNVPKQQREALEISVNRIKEYHEKQRAFTWSYKDSYDNILGQKITPIDKVGLYVPGGKASYPSSVLMNAIPAKIAGVPELIMVSPTPDGYINSMVLAAAALGDVDRIFAIGGAQAIGSLAYGTETVNQVDKIVGPGNAYVACAKRKVFGTVGIDMIAGPSEILIICDGKTPAEWIAMDLFSQAEHDELAQSIMLCPDMDFINEVEDQIKKLIHRMPRVDILKKSLSNRGALIKVNNLSEACDIANIIAPEHLEISTENATELVPLIRHAGAIFIGCFSSESLGDYCAGPNHVLPTSRTARFSSPLGVYDFQKRSSLINISEKGSIGLGKIASTLANSEGLQAHASSAQYRIDGKYHDSK
ncbi:histidinol dehydrogenase [Candidatus Kinetoplastibacterium blastocrithidii TCC012E]|uniref:Histidinol dehydrogenase n=2 Tax=Candidatus Kinetoplastidibacterium blastocrithidiae TaxID=233181 RepID=M1LZI3_9PROT|nr:histidinol dehydrogenase [Candidatus Kinetoplastibacterium blastocrithidii (ex Strigomonas culicis)]AGF49476.1 histidinol dehydrogenase [Candidatus Kinetoplastibacterium blastocrithidii TCC012E]